MIAQKEEYQHEKKNKEPLFDYERRDQWNRSGFHYHFLLPAPVLGYLLTPKQPESSRQASLL